MLGIREIFNALDDLRQVKAGMDAEHTRLARRQTKSTKERERLDDLERDLAENKEKIRAHEAARKGALRRQGEIKGRLAECRAVRDVVEERDRAGQKRARIESDALEVEKALGKKRGDLGIVMAAGLLHAVSRGEDGNGAPADDGCESKTIRRMVESNASVCICGRAVDAGALSALRARARESDPPAALLLRRFAERALIDTHAGRREAELRQLAERRLAQIQDLDSQRTIIDRCTAEINRSAPLEGFAEYEAQYDEATADMGKFDRDIERLADERSRLEREKERIERRVETGADDAGMQKSRMRGTMCDAVIDGLAESIDRFYQRRKPELERHVSKIFSLLTNNPDLYRGVGIDKEFNLVVARRDGTKLSTDMYSPSAGASQIVATAMIGGMNRFSTKEAPIVIDTPLGRLDPVHRSNVVKYYSEMGRQIIILYQPSEIGADDLECIRDQLASEWAIESIEGSPDLSRIVREASYI